MTKKSFILYDSWGKIFKKLPEEQAGKLIKTIYAYVLGEGEPDIEDPALSAIFDLIRDRLDEDYQAYEEKVARLKKNSSPKSSRNRSDIDTKSERNRAEVEPKSTRNRDDIEGVTVTVTDTVSISKDIDKGIGKRASAFRPPDVSEVRSYCQERKNKVDPERFVDFYTSKGWLVGKSKMKDWRAAVRNWEKEENARSGTTQQSTKQGYIRSDYDIDAIERALVKNG